MQRNYEPLTSSVARIDFSNFRRQFKIKKANSNLSYVVLFMFLLSISYFYKIILESLFSIGWQYALIGIIISVSVVAFVVIILIKSANNRLIRFVRLSRFAEANGMTYYPLTLNPNYGGMIFSIGDGRNSHDQLISMSGKAFEIANYSYVIGSGKSRRIIEKGYIRVQLDRNLPHMVLDSVSNNTNLFGLSLSNLPVSFDKNQRLSLEGNFDKYFTLYAPADYEQDALYVFTPDLMALFIDSINGFDAEIVDNYLYIYSNHPFNLTNQAELERIFRIIDTVGVKTVIHTEHYVDEAVGSSASNIVADPGRRLKTRIPWLVIMIFVIIVLLIVWLFATK